MQETVGGFNYEKYLKSKNIHGIVICSNNQISLENKKINSILIFVHKVKNNLENNFKKWMPNETSSILMGLILGNKNYLSQGTKDNFTNSSLAHLLVVSGAHISYLILGISILFSKLKFSKKISYFLSILVLIMFSTMVGWTPSVIRASIAGILALFAKIIYKKSDIYTNLSISSLIILISNPYSIWDIGFLLSYFATIGIIFFYPILMSFFNKKTKKFKFIKECTAISISSQIFILPILSYIFNKFSFNFIISNILATPLFIFAILYGFIILIIGSVFNELGNILSILLNFDLKALIFVSEIMSKNQWANLLVTRPNLFFILIYYLIFILLKFIYNINSLNKQKDYLTGLEKIQIKFINRIKHNKSKIIKFISIIFCILIILKIVLYFIPQNLKINFIDVGQGDCTLIETPYKKKILIDGGGSQDANYDVGEKVVIPYLLNKNIRKIDYIIISHFDSDHVGRFTYSDGKIKGRHCSNFKTREDM